MPVASGRPIPGVDPPQLRASPTGAAGVPAVLSVFRIHPVRIDGTAMFARALSKELTERGARSVLCFPSAPPEFVRDFIGVPGGSFEVEPGIESGISDAMAGVRRILRRHRPAILHLHFMPLISPLPWMARVCDVRKIFFTDHSSGPEELPPARSFLKQVTARAITWPIERIVSVSRYSLNERLSLRQGSPDRFRLIYNGVDLERVAAASRVGHGFRERFAIPPGRVVIAHASWLIPEKGGADFLDAARVVLDACPHTHFVVAGSGPCLDQYRETAAATGIASHCTFTGEVADPFFEGLFAASDIICQPSRWREAFCWVAAEAMAFGKPVVATNSGALSEVVRDRETGFLVKRRDAGELALRLIELASDAALRERMGRAALRSVADRFPLDRNIREHMMLYGI